ncbi:ankyrin repeat-containing protein BDA1 isoform X1 [Hevea brasiliensis]|uniref:ankyrin repeat-containing protein BDA1 isoform X1 n=1 Tax=Hevea brasiliensis TaxID=3981 RepID=UPI0025D482F0|nr:ankyrin repeat-containing protein BDA1 isoform X1 [Hevea brasiliensis]
MTVKYFYKSLTLPERMDLIGTLFKAAQMGDANELRSLIDEDELILARSSLASTADTALHIATLAGKLNFVEELMTLKPELAERLNRDGFSPIHIASANGYTEIVRVLLRRGGEMMSHLRSGDGRTALHFAVITGSIDVVLELITAVPECKNDLTHEQESVFHLAVKNCQFEVFGQLVWKLKAQNQQELKVMLNARDCQGNTILHLATSRKLHRIVKVLLGEDDAIAIDKVDVNVKNKNNLTALDMSYVPENTISGAEANGKSIRSMLQHAGALRSQDIVIPQHANPTVCFHCLPRTLREYFSEQVSSLFTCKMWAKMKKEIENSTSEMRSAVMVVAVLIATVTFQSVSSPPGGFQQSNNDIGFQEHSNGMAAVASDPVIYVTLMILNLVGFFSSIAMILMLTSGFPLKNLLRMAVLATSGSFLITVVYIGPTEYNATYVVAMVMTAIVLLQVVRFIFWLGNRFVDCGSCCGSSVTENNSGV